MVIGMGTERFCVENDFPDFEGICDADREACGQPGINGCKETLWNFCKDSPWRPLPAMRRGPGLVLPRQGAAFGSDVQAGGCVLPGQSRQRRVPMTDAKQETEDGHGNEPDERKGGAWRAVAVLAALLGAAAPATGAGRGGRPPADARRIAKAKKEMQRADGELRRTDSLMRDESSRAAQAEERQAKDRERRDKEIAALQARLQETQGKIGAEKAALARHQNAVDEIKSREAHLRKVLAGYCDSLAARVEAGLPWDNQARLDRIRALKRDLEAGTASPEEGLARLSAILKEEVKAGDEIAVFSKPVNRANGETVNAQVLRLGNQWLVYMDEEGKRFGVMERKGGTWAWREDIAFGEKNRIREAIEVKSAKRPPQLVVLDLDVAAGAPTAAGAPRKEAPK